MAFEKVCSKEMSDIFKIKSINYINKWEQPVRFTSIYGRDDDYIYYDTWRDQYMAYYKPHNKPNDHLHVHIPARIIDSVWLKNKRLIKFSKIS